MHCQSYIERYRPATKAGALAFDLSVIVAASFFIAACSQLEFFIPFSPVPVTAQTLAVLVTGLTLGATGGASAVLAYLAEGSLGLPFFAGGSSGVHHLIGPSGGYLAGFVAAAFLAGFFAEVGWNRSLFSLFFAMVLADLAIYLFGVPWLSNFVGRGQAMNLGFFPFILGDLVKVTLISLSFSLTAKRAG